MICKSGDRLCNCTLLQKCGSGAYGEVWLAEDAIGTRVALKIIENRGSYSERELAGLRNYKECNHPNLLKIRYVEITDDRICYTMDAADDLNRGEGEYLPDTLANRLQRSGRLGGREIGLMLDGLLAGLEELHRRKLVHRDIKPDNILWVNGRPTLADAGLIAQDGKGSLVGTPGFLSPKLMEGRGAAEASDDFYALGKVIYCALTGLPVREYPSLPADMTISVDAGLNRALRESCSHPVHSTAEFRRLLQGVQDQFLEKDEPRRPDRKTFRNSIRLLWKVAVWGISLFLIAGFLFGGLLLWGRVREMEQRHVPEPVPGMSESELKTRLKEAEEELARSQEKIAEAQRQYREFQEKMPELTAKPETGLEVSVAETLRTGTPGPAVAEGSFSAGENPEPAREIEVAQKGRVPESAFQRETTGAQAVKLFKRSGFLDDGGILLPMLLNYKVMTGRMICELIMGSTSNPRLQPIAGAPPRRMKVVSPLESELVGLFKTLYPDFERSAVAQRQQHWRNVSGTAVEKQRAMLMKDPLMQAVALDALIRAGVNRVLENDRMQAEERTYLLELLRMRYLLLDPEGADMIFRQE